MVRGLPYYLDELLSQILDEKGVNKLRDGVMRLRETQDPAWLYHALACLYPDYYGGDVYYRNSYGKFYKTYSVEPQPLPPPRSVSGKDALEVIASRRSRRSLHGPIDILDVSTILYYTVGITGKAWWGGPKRSYPSAGALQPIEAYIVAYDVTGLEKGLYHYNPGLHALERLGDAPSREEMSYVSLEQEHVGNAPLVLILTAVIARTASKYGYRSYRYVHWDAGHAGENVYLVVEALGLGTVAVGAYYDEEVCKLLDIDCVGEIPMLIYPIGVPHPVE